MVRFLKNQPTSHNSSAEAIITVKSRLLIPPIGKGEIVALQPNTKNILNRLLPITFPMAIPGFFFNAAVIEVASSGKEVPPATKVNPITDSLTPNERAIPLAPSTKSCPPKMSPARPPIIKRTDFHIGISFIFCSSPASSLPFRAMAKVYRRKMRKKASRMSPSTRPIIFSALPSSITSLAQKKSTSEARMTNGISLLMVPSPTLMGSTAAVHPIIIKALKVLLPTTLPIAISALPFKAESTLITNSGADVPKATMVRPITKSEIRKRLATAAEPSVRPFAPSNIRAKPPIKRRVSNINLSDWIL